MGLPASPYTFRAFGLCDSIDGSNSPPGAMASLKNLIPNPKTAQQFVPRPASVQLSNFSGLTTPLGGTVLLVIGTRAYGMIASGSPAGKDRPFCYDLSAAAFVTIGNIVAGNCPTTPATSGEWSPPSMAQVGNRIMITHPGYTGANKIGWIDMRSFSLATLTGDTHTNTTLDALSGNPITLGVMVGDAVTGTGIPAGTYVVSLTAAGVVLSQAATASAAGVAITFTSGTRAAPIYGAGNTNTNPLVQAPLWVSQFNGRAWYAVRNGLVYSDSLSPCQVTNATQGLILGDDTDVTCIGGLPLSGQLQAGIVQSLIAFKGAAPYWQITGDAATSNLTVDQVQGSIGTRAPNSVQPLTHGLGYISPDGFRVISPETAMPSEPIGADGQGVALPFIYAVSPSRIAAAFNKNIYRVSVQNGAIGTQAVQEFWYDLKRNIFTGPHDFPAAIIAASPALDSDFVLFASGIDAKLWQSTISPSAASTYTENGAVMNIMWTTSLLPENQTGNSNWVVESSIGLAMPASQVLTFQATDEAGISLDTFAISGSGGAGALWNAFNWGTGVWGGSVAGFVQWSMPWTQGLSFKQAQISCFGPAVSGFVAGNLIAKIEATGFQGAHAP
jgi:hypothetical protein